MIIVVAILMMGVVKELHYIYIYTYIYIYIYIYIRTHIEREREREREIEIHTFRYYNSYLLNNWDSMYSEKEIFKFLSF